MLLTIDFLLLMRQLRKHLSVIGKGWAEINFLRKARVRAGLRCFLFNNGRIMEISPEKQNIDTVFSAAKTTAAM